jgi:hypothetical protein
MRLMRRLAGILAAASLAAIFQPASATILAPLDLAQLVEGADAIVCGRVADVFAVRVAGRFTDSLVTLVPASVLKGAASGDVVFRVPGGESGRFRTVVVGAPVLRAGDEVVVFLAGAPPQIPHLVGFSQGLLPVVRDDTGRALLMVPPAAAAAGERPASASGAARVMTLAVFADEVRAIVEGRARDVARRTAPRRPGSAGPGRP